MANDELGKLSPEQIQKLANTISKAKSLTDQQEEIIQKVLDGEIDIGNTRIAKLEKYFDVYSKNLDQVASKYSSLNEDFLILDGKLAESYKKLSSDITKLGKQLKNTTEESDKAAAKSSQKNKSAAEKATDTRNAAKVFDAETTNAIKQIAKALTERTSANKAISYSPSENDSKATAAANSQITTSAPSDTVGTQSETIGTGAVIPQTVDVSEIINSEADRALLQIKDTSINDLLTDYHKYANEVGKVTNAINELNAANVSGDQARIAAAKNSYNTIAEEFGKHLQTLQNKKEKYLDDIAEQEKAAKDKQLELEFARMQTQEMQAARLTEFRLKELDKVHAAELETQNFENELAAEIAFANSPEAIEFKVREDEAKNKLADSKKQAEQLAKFTAERELFYKQKNGGILDKDSRERIQKELKEKLANQKKNEENLSKERARLAKIEYQEAKEKERQELREGVSALTAKGASLDERKQALYSLTHDDDGNVDKNKALSAATAAISDLAAKLESSIDKIASYKGDIDTRLQGSNNEKVLGSYWDQLSRDMMKVGAVTPYFKQEDFANNIKSLVEQGIAFDLKQRAFLMTIQEKIANTFEVADGTLLRLIRIQQEDSTAGRLGMESALNSFLNNMYENTEYLKDVAASVRGSLEEMEALMGGAAATEVEYQVQKWMGSLYSVGMSQNAVQGIANALGQIASGQVDALSNGGAGNLLVMAANDAGIPIADILAKGLNAEETNRLLQATVNYLAEIAKSTENNNVVQQQLADVFGVKASDIRAATNLVQPNTTSDIFSSNMSYDNMLGQLNNMAGSMALRTSIAEMMTNVWENGQYTIAGSMANNPISYLIYKVASLIDDAAGGIDLPFVNVMGFGVDLNTTVSDLMRVAAVGTGILGSLGSMIQGLGTSMSGQAMLSKMGIESGSGLQVTPRGSTSSGIGAGDNSGGAPQTTSGSGYVGNNSPSDIKDSTIQESEDSKKQQMIEAKEEEEANKVDFLNTYVLKIYELLDDVASGKRSLNVKMSNYGLSRLGNSSSMSSAQGGVAGLLSNNAASNIANNAFSDSNSGIGSGVSSSSGYNNDFGNTNIGLGGWSMT